jgi:hypothetical protein
LAGNEVILEFTHWAYCCCSWAVFCRNQLPSSPGTSSPNRV